jgi:hypothetical protein
MANTQPGVALARDAADELQKRFKTKTVTNSYDTDKAPLITINDGTPVAGEKNFVIKIVPRDWSLNQDILGQTAIPYGPNTVQICTEANSGSDILAPQDLLSVFGVFLSRGIKVEWYQVANGSAPATTDITAANLKASYANLVYPLQSSR